MFIDKLSQYFYNAVTVKFSVLPDLYKCSLQVFIHICMYMFIIINVSLFFPRNVKIFDNKISFHREIINNQLKLEKLIKCAHTGAAFRSVSVFYHLLPSGACQIICDTLSKL